MSDDIEVSANTWCHTARPYRLLVLDGRVAFFLLLWMVHICWETFVIAVGATLIFGSLEYARLPLPIAYRRLRSLLAGRLRPARPPRRLFR